MASSDPSGGLSLVNGRRIVQESVTQRRRGRREEWHKSTVRSDCALVPFFSAPSASLRYALLNYPSSIHQTKPSRRVAARHFLFSLFQFLPHLIRINLPQIIFLPNSFRTISMPLPKRNPSLVLHRRFQQHRLYPLKRKMLLHLPQQHRPDAATPVPLRHIQSNNMSQRWILLRQNKSRDLLPVFRHHAICTRQTQIIMQRPLAIRNPRRKTLLVQLMQPRKILSLILPGSNRHKKVGAQQTGPPGDPHPIFFNSRCVGAALRRPLFFLLWLLA